MFVHGCILPIAHYCTGSCQTLEDRWDEMGLGKVDSHTRSLALYHLLTSSNSNKHRDPLIMITFILVLLIERIKSIAQLRWRTHACIYRYMYNLVSGMLAGYDEGMNFINSCIIIISVVVVDNQYCCCCCDTIIEKAIEVRSQQLSRCGLQATDQRNSLNDANIVVDWPNLHHVASTCI